MTAAALSEVSNGARWNPDPSFNVGDAILAEFASVLKMVLRVGHVLVPAPKAKEMSASRIRELEEMAAKLSATARKLPSGQDRQDVFREITKFRDKIAALKIAERSAQGPKD